MLPPNPQLVALGTRELTKIRLMKLLEDNLRLTPFDRYDPSLISYINEGGQEVASIRQRHMTG